MKSWTWDCARVDRRLDPYLAVVTDPRGSTTSGLFATLSKGRAWAREYIKRNS